MADGDSTTSTVPRIPDPEAWQPQTRLVRGGSRRTAFNETTEALFMTSGYVYGSAEEAEQAFANSGTPRFVYSRYSNPRSEERRVGKECRL